MNQPFVRPDVRAYLDIMAANPRPPMNNQLVAMSRQMSPEVAAQMFAVMDMPVGELGEVRDLEMPGPDGSMALRLFDVRPTRGPGPVMVFYHGGGFVVGNIDTHASLCAELSRGLDLPVISVEYRLAPEDKWPAAVDDAEAAARWIAENGAAFGREFTHLILCGDSAGGTLTLVTALALRDRPAAVPFLMQIPIYPVADASREYESDRLFGTKEYGLDSESMAYFGEAYAPDPLSPRHSAVLGDLAGLPPTLVVTAGLDPLRDQGRAFAARAIEAGVDVTYREFAGTIHGFCSFRKAIPSAQEDLAIIVKLANGMIQEALQAR